MKLLFDQNISHKIVAQLKDIFQDCSQVRLEGLENYSDISIWEYAKQHNFSIVTFDADFYDISTLKGHPPKIIWLRVGNTSTSNLKKTIEEHNNSIHEFHNSKLCAELSCLEIL